MHSIKTGMDIYETVIALIQVAITNCSNGGGIFGLGGHVHPEWLNL
jgi:hypothetical protein